MTKYGLEHLTFKVVETTGREQSVPSKHTVLPATPIQPKTRTADIDCKDANPNNANPIKIKIVGVGGAGCNMAMHIGSYSLEGVACVAIDVDVSDTDLGPAIQPVRISGGHGSGADPVKGRQMVAEHKEEIAKHLENADMVFVCAGMGGGLGTGGAPVVAEIARSSGALTVAMAVHPFSCQYRDHIVSSGIDGLRNSVDALIELSNQKLIELHGHKSFQEAFAELNNVLYGAVRGIHEIIHLKGVINVDFSNVCAVMEDNGQIFIGTGRGSGEDAVKTALREAIDNPLIGADLKEQQAQAILYNVVVPETFPLEGLNMLEDLRRNVATPNCVPNLGLAVDPNMQDEVRITLVASIATSHQSTKQTMATNANSPPKPETDNLGTRTTQTKNIDYDAPSYTRRSGRNVIISDTIKSSLKK